MWPKVLFKRFLDLVEVAKKGDTLIFTMLSDEVIKQYKMLDIEQQGQFHELVSNYMNKENNDD